ncbi:hypothetical protein T265_09048 [Opisthorchis viverrini]|uniref:Uncharacterized protein n=1 Tax=Opisthorchis viverrini TaxID=6198 RepID=A0A074ZBJ0_OPIVI|nr:hypothetical protein T265_09048 [Opisthorchis viverrini]KER22962.1 hypothetical protein T265_09048 [Opisthorchis viverrini]
MYRDISNIVATETCGGLVQHIQSPGYIKTGRFSWVPGESLKKKQISLQMSVYSNIRLTETQRLRLPDEPQEERNRPWAVEAFSATLEKNRSAVAPFRCLTAMSSRGSTRTGIVPGCPSLDMEIREAEVGSVNLRSNHLSNLAPNQHREALRHNRLMKL